MGKWAFNWVLVIRVPSQRDRETGQRDMRQRQRDTNSKTFSLYPSRSPNYTWRVHGEYHSPYGTRRRLYLQSGQPRTAHGCLHPSRNTATTHLLRREGKRSICPRAIELGSVRPNAFKAGVQNTISPPPLPERDDYIQTLCRFSDKGTSTS